MLWGGILTQTPPTDVHKAISDMHHSPLAFLRGTPAASDRRVSGSFKANKLGWSTIEKELYAIVYSIDRLAHLTLTTLVYIHTDHRNIHFLFNRHEMDLPKYALDKVTRWALKLSIYTFVVRHTPGELNVWPDLLSRWGAPRVRRVLVTAPPRYDHTGVDSDISKPALKAAQTLLTAEEKSNAEVTEDIYTVKGKALIPADAIDFKTRVLVVAHCGPAGHYTADDTLHRIAEVFVWQGLRSDVNSFLASCNCCLKTKGAGIIPRPLAFSLHATLPREILHSDYLYIGNGKNLWKERSKYLLLLKDDLSSWLGLDPYLNADGKTQRVLGSNGLQPMGLQNGSSLTAVATSEIRSCQN